LNKKNASEDGKAAKKVFSCVEAIFEKSKGRIYALKMMLCIPSVIFE